MKSLKEDIYKHKRELSYQIYIEFVSNQLNYLSIISNEKILIRIKINDPNNTYAVLFRLRTNIEKRIESIYEMPNK